MLKQIYFYLLVLVILLICSCVNRKSYRSGVVFTFDDRYLSEWYEASDFFNGYNIKATVFVARPQKRTRKQVVMLKKFEEDGLEIACHSMNHIDLSDFLTNHSLIDYINQEVKPAIEVMTQVGLKLVHMHAPMEKARQNRIESGLNALRFYEKQPAILKIPI